MSSCARAGLSVPLHDNGEEVAEDAGVERGAQQPTAAHDASQTSCGQRVVDFILGKTWIVPPTILLVLGTRVGYRLATAVATVLSWLTLLVSYIKHRSRPEAEDSARNREIDRTANASNGGSPQDKARRTSKSWLSPFDLLNAVLYTALLPVALRAGDDFCRLWVGTIILGAMMLAAFVSVAVGKPLLEGSIPLNDDPRTDPMVRAVQRDCTLFVGAIFVVMEVCNLTVAFLGLKVGTAFILLNFVVPYGTLAVGLVLIQSVGKRAYIQAAVRA
eukprot:TRINITY_DN7349_c0_g1_i10.p1 TRINITY_DN7349_c0_g1~~TRINITY_DN7349_c0_g1_i10.p1  ORF type:complete len:274 (-),score=19.87 TRINITY_DN7349_c0_g1_i10:181-1002(-)